MQRKTWKSALLLFCCIACASGLSAQQPAIPAPITVPYVYRADLVEVHDGDSLVLHIDQGFGTWKHGVNIRLLDVYAPEVRTTNLVEKKKGLLVKEFLMKEILRLAPDRRVIVQTHKDDDDKYGRYLGVIWAGGKDMNAAVRDFMTSQGIKPSGKGVKP